MSRRNSDAINVILKKHIDRLTEQLSSSSGGRLYYLCLLNDGVEQCCIPVLRGQGQVCPLSDDSLSRFDWRLSLLPKELQDFPCEWTEIALYRDTSCFFLADCEGIPSARPAVHDVSGEGSDYRYEHIQTLSKKDLHNYVETVLSRKIDDKVKVTQNMARRNVVLLFFPSIISVIPGLALMANAISVSMGVLQGDLPGLAVGAGLLLSLTAVCLFFLIQESAKVCSPKKLEAKHRQGVRSTLQKYFRNVFNAVGATQPHYYQQIPAKQVGLERT